MRPCRLLIVPSVKGGVAFVQVFGQAQDEHLHRGLALRHSQQDCGALVQAEERLQLQHLPLPAPSSAFAVALG